MNVSTVLTKILREKVVVNQNGRRKTVTKLEAALMQLTNKAASGEIRALRQLVELARESEAKQNMPRPAEPADCPIPIGIAKSQGLQALKGKPDACEIIDDAEGGMMRRLEGSTDEKQPLTIRVIYGTDKGRERKRI